MTHHIVGYLNTEYNLAADAYKIFFDYVAPEPDEDVDKFVAIATRRFGEELRRTIQAHHERRSTGN